MKIIVNTGVIVPSGETIESTFARTKRDVNNDYVLQSGETFSPYITDIQMAYKLLLVDYKRYRAGLQNYGLVDDITWNSYDDFTKRLICTEKATTMERINLYINDSEIVNTIMKAFDKQSIDCRQDRFGKAKAALLSNLEEISAFMVYAVMSQANLENNYVKHGMEGSESLDPVVGIYDFLNSTNIAGSDAYGTPWAAFAVEGLATRSMTFRAESTHNQASLVQLLNEYLKYGKKID